MLFYFFFPLMKRVFAKSCFGFGSVKSWLHSTQNFLDQGKNHNKGNLPSPRFVYWNTGVAYLGHLAKISPMTHKNTIMGRQK